MKIRHLILFFSFVFISNVTLGLESQTHYWYNRGYYTNSIHALQKELNQVKTSANRSSIYYDLANSYYAISFVEEYRKYVELAYKFAKQKKVHTYLDEVDYGISMMRYYNFEVKPFVALGYYHKIYSLLRQVDPKHTDVRWIKLYQAIATTRRNYVSEYDVINAYYDSAYSLMKQHKLVNTLDEVNYYRSRGLINLDKVSSTSNPLFYHEALRCFSKALSILKNQQLENYPVKIGIQTLNGLVGYMRRDAIPSLKYFDEAFESVQQATKFPYHAQDIQSILLNVSNYSTFTLQLLYQKNKDVSMVRKQLRKLKQLTQSFESFSKKNKDIDISVFTDIYGYSPYNSMIFCYHALYQQTHCKAFIDSAYYYGEKNKTPWIPMRKTFQQVIKEADEIVANNDVIVQYGDYQSLYAIVRSKKGRFMVSFGRTDKMQRLNVDYTNWNYPLYARETNMYYRTIFRPLECFFQRNARKVIVNNTPFFEHVNLECLVTDTSKSCSKLPFLGSKYAIFYQPSMRAYNVNSYSNLKRVSLLKPAYSKSEKSQIRFTGKEFNRWIKKNNIEQSQNNIYNSDVLLIAAHGFGQNHRVDNAYIDLGKNIISIRNVCKRKIKTNLVVLAICDGGIGQQISQGSSFSLASAFLFSGAKSCVYSNWKLDDKIASEILGDFLKRLANGEPKDWALRNAKMNYLKNVKSMEGYNPIYWGGLQVMGDVSPVEMGGLRLRSV